MTNKYDEEANMSNRSKVVQRLIERKSVDDIELTEDDKIFLFGKAKDFKAEAEYFEIYERNDLEASRLYDIADKLWDIAKD